ncbi:hypothetical protein [Halobacterium yunchengense]|uniref:hypothetical protein n=1 Tax=Halobacterium yunchengense TaxID=3108497 RepID=UPI00300AE5B7
MRAGVVALVDGSFRKIDSYAETTADGDRELARRLEVDRVFSLPDGDAAFAGRAAAERVAPDREVSVDEDGITVTDQRRVTTAYTEVVGVPGEFVAAASSDGAFAFDLVGAETGTSLERATLDLDAFLDDRPDATPWRVGVAGRGDGSVNGTFHAADLRASRDLDALRDGATVTQLGLAYDYGGDAVKMTAARSGYVEVYQPAAYDAAEFLTYVRDEVLDYVA